MGKKKPAPAFSLEALPGARPQGFPRSYQPEKATLSRSPFSQEGWIFEPKLDGIRAVAFVQDGKVKLLSRNALNMTARYPELSREIAASAKHDLLLDGEIVMLDERGVPSFQLLQQRSGLTRGSDVAHADKHYPIIYYVFDIVYADGYNLERIPLSERKLLLKHYLKETEHIRYVEGFSGDGRKIFQMCIDKGLEGVVAKRLDSPYEPGRRSRSWLKLKHTLSSEFLICGYTLGTGRRNSTFGALLVGYHDKAGKLTYAGKVGTGFNQSNLASILKQLNPLKTTRSPFSQKIPERHVQWAQPKLVAEIKFAEVTRDGLLRAPVFLRLREDIRPQDVKHPPVPMELIK